MKELLQEIKRLQGVVGVFVYTKDLGVVALDVPSTFSEPNLDRIGVFVKAFFRNQTTQAYNVMSLEVKNKESLFLYKKIDDAATLIIICDTNVRMSLVNMTTNMLLAELKAGVDLITSKLSLDEFTMESNPVTRAVPSPVEASPAQTSPAVPVPMDVDKLMKEGPFADIAAKLEEAMSRAIGPIGAMTVRDCIEKWVEGGSPSKNRFNALLGILLKEIGDAHLEKEFKNEVGSLLRS